jgi:hypothetical protein
MGCDKMRSIKRINPDGSTRLITVRKDNGVYVSFTPMEAAKMINCLRNELWSGMPLKNKDMR